MFDDANPAIFRVGLLPYSLNVRARTAQENSQGQILYSDFWGYEVSTALLFYFVFVVVSVSLVVFAALSTALVLVSFVMLVLLKGW